MLDFSTFKTLALVPFTAILGIDHLSLRSPFTAFLKFIVNLVFFGAWYFYDIIQVLTDAEFVAKYGLSTPWGPRGHGYRLFNDTLTKNGAPAKHPNEFSNPSKYNGGGFGTLNFVLYAMLTPYIGFIGLPTFIAGDNIGGIFKLLSSLLLAPYYLITGLIDYANSGKVEKEGIPRSWPVQGLTRLFLHDNTEYYPAKNILPTEEFEEQIQVHDAKLKEFKEQQTTKTPGVTAWEALYGYITSPIRLMGASARGLEAGADATKAASKITDLTAKGMEKSLASGEPLKVPGDLPGRDIPLSGPSTPEASTTTPAPTQAPQAGGALIRTDAENQWDMILLIGLGLFVFGGFAVTLVRKMTPPKRKDEDEYPRKTYDRDDAPPKPRGV